MRGEVRAPAEPLAADLTDVTAHVAVPLHVRVELDSLLSGEGFAAPITREAREACSLCGIIGGLRFGRSLSSEYLRDGRHKFALWVP